MNATGWLLDVYIEGGKAVLWLKLDRSRTLRLVDRYTPDFYVKSRSNVSLKNLAKVLNEHQSIKDVVIEARFISLEAEEKARVLHVFADCARNFRRVLYDVLKTRMVAAHFSTDLLHVQRYLFQRSFAPASRVEVEYDEAHNLRSLRVLCEDFEMEPPPFTSVIFDVEAGKTRFTPDVHMDPISRVVVFSSDERLQTAFQGEESEVLHNFASYIKGVDPDFLVSNQADAVLEYVLRRARLQGINLQLGRDLYDIQKLHTLIQHAHKGRVHINLDTFMEIGISGVVEKSRFAMVPPGLAVKWAPGRMIDSRQCFEASQKGILLPKAAGNLKEIATAWETIFRDRGSLLLSPKVGLHENVAELDFESMYPHIIVKHNISYETVGSGSARMDKSGFLGELTERFLRRRLFYKHLKRKYGRKRQEWVWCDQRQRALKGVLVCIYGYSGCFANRFGNVATYEEINRVARDILVESLNTVLHNGFEAIYADSDSLFVKKENATKQDYERLAENVSSKTGLPLSVNHHYKFLVLLKQETDPKLEATRRYFGRLMNGELHYRGIELRRHDCPLFLKQFQEKLMEILFNTKSEDAVRTLRFKKALDLVASTCGQIRSDAVQLDKLIVSKSLRKSAAEYRSLFPHVVAALQMAQKRKKLATGESVRFLYVNAAHQNPFRRVVPAALLESKHVYYDKAKYVELALDVAETVLSVFGFNRKQFESEEGCKLVTEF